MTDDQKAGSYMSSSEPQECCHPCTHTHMQQGSRVWSRHSPEVSSNLNCCMTVNTRVTKHQQAI